MKGMKKGMKGVGGLFCGTYPAKAILGKPFFQTSLTNKPHITRQNHLRTFLDNLDYNLKCVLLWRVRSDNCALASSLSKVGREKKRAVNLLSAVTARRVNLPVTSSELVFERSGRRVDIRLLAEGISFARLRNQ